MAALLTGDTCPGLSGLDIGVLENGIYLKNIVPRSSACMMHDSTADYYHVLEKLSNTFRISGGDFFFSRRSARYSYLATKEN